MDIVALLNAIQEKIVKDAGESRAILSVREYTPPFRVYLVDTDAGTYCVTARSSEVTLIPLEKGSTDITWDVSMGQKKASE